MLGCFRIGENLVNLSALQRDLVTLVLKTDDELFSGCSHGLVDVALDLELFASNPVGFVPVYLG